LRVANIATSSSMFFRIKQTQIIDLLNHW